MQQQPTSWQARTTQPRARRIGIMGGGLAGLTAAYELQKLSIAQSLPLEIYLIESAARLGGQIETDHFPNSQLRYEAGAELVSGSHRSLLTLCAELNVPVENFYDSSDEPKTLFDIGGKLHTQEDFERDFAPLARAVAEDEDKALRHEDVRKKSIRKIDWSYRQADAFDKMSIREYLKQKQRDLKKAKIFVPDWVIEAACIAYGGEIGNNARNVSALNFVTMLDSAQIRNGKNVGIEMPGEGDAIYHLKEGNESLITALKKAIEANNDKVPCHLETKSKVYDIDRRYGDDEDRPFALHAQNERLSPSPLYDAVISCVPPQRLTDIVGWDDAIYGMGKDIHTASVIDELRGGVLTKVSLTLRNPKQVFQEINNGNPFQGVIYSDSIAQTVWMSPQSADNKDKGVVTCYMAGKLGMHNGELKQACRNALLNLVNRSRSQRDLPAMQENELFAGEEVATHWDANSRDAFVAPGRSQFIDLCHLTAHHQNFSISGSFIPNIVITDVPDGKDIDIQVGYMNNAVTSAKASAQHIFEVLKNKSVAKADQRIAL